MNVAFEISPLITASGTFGDKSGVYRYMIGLLNAYIQFIEKKDKKSKVILFSFNRDLIKYPLNPEVLKIAEHPQVILLNKVPKLQKKSAIEAFRDTIVMDIPVLRTLIIAVNKTFAINKLQLELANRVNFHKYYHFLDDTFRKLRVDVVLHSDTGFFQMLNFKNIVIVYDLTALTLTHLHRDETTDLQRRKMRFARLYCDGVICISQKTRKDLIKYSRDFIKKRLVVCYPGLDAIFTKKKETSDKTSLERINKILAKKKTRVKKGRYLLYYGTFEPRKNLQYLVKAFCDLTDSQEIPKDFKLILTGGEGWGKIKKLIQTYIQENYQPIEENNVIVLNFLNDSYLIDFIRNAYAVVYPSLYEGFGLPVLESMSQGTPVISSNTSSLPEVGGNSVVYIDPHDFFDLKDKMRSFIGDPALAALLSKRGLGQSKRFTWQASAISLWEFLHKL